MTQHLQSIGPVWFFSGMEVHPITGVLHVMFYRRQPPQDTWLGTVDPITGALTVTVPVTGAGNPEAIAINSQGVMIMSQASGQRYFQLDYNTGVATLIGNTAIPGSICQDLAFDSQDRLWGVFGDWAGGPNSGIYEIDLSAMTTTKLISTTKYYTGIAFTRDTQVQSYCVAKTSSLGCTPTLSAEGLASPAATLGFTIRATHLNNQRTGMLLYSAAGRAALPFQGGTLCLNVPLNRSPASSSSGASLPAQNCTGSFAIDYNELIWDRFGGRHFGPKQIVNSPFLVPGTQVQCQYWGRDPGFPAPNNSMLSDAVEFTLAP